ncbi:MAG: hypothetical protein JO317_03275 [Verrucomicrobiae bacterium]|nr:hypothetical protein [Verrucomicrobiae bacterium]
MKIPLYAMVLTSLMSAAVLQAKAEDVVQQTTTTTTTSTTFTPDEQKIFKEKIVIEKPSGTTVKKKTVTVTKGKKLTETIYKEAREVPADVVTALPTQPENTKLVIIGNEVVRVSEPSHEVIDVYDLVP